MARKPRRPRKPGPSAKTNFHPESVGDWDTGYGRPPEEGQFKPGQSGNPPGRPVGSKNKPPAPIEIAKTLLARASRDVSFSDGGVPKTASVIETLVEMMLRSAMLGDKRVQRDLIKLLLAAEKEVQANKSRRYEAMRFYVDEKRRIQADRYEEGLAPRKFALHPDDVIFDHENETFHINLLNDEQFDIAKKLLNLLEWEQCEYNHLIDDLERAKTLKEIFQLRGAIVSTFKLIKKLQECLGIPWTTEVPDEPADYTVLQRLKPKAK